MDVEIELMGVLWSVEIDITQYQRSASFHEPGEGAHFTIERICRLDDPQRRDVWPKMSKRYRRLIEDHDALQSAANEAEDDSYEAYLAEVAEGREGIAWV